MEEYENKIQKEIIILN